jgi:diadenosine tetraphosphatase ApaH/serine/threonine PP2A family protein phosphatase
MPTFFAILSDIHANIDALEAVLTDVRQWPCSRILCLGDIVGYGPEPAACVELMRENAAVSVIGNHEAIFFMASDLPPEELGASIGAPIRLACEQMTDSQRAWLESLPIAADLDPITLCHASLHEPPAFNYIQSPEDVEANFAAQTTFASFHGHTHIPAIWESNGGNIRCFQPGDQPVRLDQDGRYAINVGSVGQPRDGDPRASYALYDYEKRLLLHRRVEYDITKARARFKRAKLPATNAKRLSKGR